MQKKQILLCLLLLPLLLISCSEENATDISNLNKENAKADQVKSYDQNSRQKNIEDANINYIGFYGESITNNGEFRDLIQEIKKSSLSQETVDGSERTSSSRKGTKETIDLESWSDIEQSLLNFLAKIGIQLSTEENDPFLSNRERQELNIKASRLLRPFLWAGNALVNPYWTSSHKIDGSLYIKKRKKFNTPANRVVLYLHGGGYVLDILPIHWDFLAGINKRLNKKDPYGKNPTDMVIFDYPKAPENTAKTTIERTVKMYQKLLEEYSADEIIIGGDSAGGSLAISLCLELKKKGLPQPAKLFTLSPYVDMGLTDPNLYPQKVIDKYIKRDFLLNGQLFDYSYIHEFYPGNIDMHDPRISPINGDLSGLPDLYMTVGTEELLYPSILAFYKKVKKQDYKVHLDIIEGQQHISPTFPFPSSEKVRDKVTDLILSVN